MSPDFVTLDCAEYNRLKAIEIAVNTPELLDFPKAVALEAAHQRGRWGAEKNKTDADFSAVLTYLHGKAIKAGYDGNTEKLLHHIITSAAVLNNWHAYRLSKKEAQ